MCRLSHANVSNLNVLFYFHDSPCFSLSVPAPYSCTASNRQIELNSETGVLASYNYPLPYDDYGGCTWIIRVDGNKHIELSFDFFNLSDPSPECLDYVQIENEALDYGKNIPKFCGSEKPSPVNSKGSAMWVWFTSSGNTKYPGFKASYKTKCEYSRYYIMGHQFDAPLPAIFASEKCLKLKQHTVLVIEKSANI